ncbi:MAG: hypothetical protein AB1847_10705 [bacterium]
MFSDKRSLYRLAVGLFVVITGIIFVSPIVFVSPIAQAQNWINLPPYNTLWPLWSPALSPEDPQTGTSTPVVTNLTPTTVLPVQPGLTWDPAWDYPWLLYNTPAGMAYFDPVYGFNLWPPPHLIDPATGSALPLTLKGGSWPGLPAPLIDWGQQYVPLANITYAFLYGLDPLGYGLLLIPAAIWGL